MNIYTDSGHIYFNQISDIGLSEVNKLVRLGWKIVLNFQFPHIKGTSCEDSVHHSISRLNMYMKSLSVSC